MRCSDIQITRHAFERMFERAIPPRIINVVVAAQGEIIARYPDDTPYPSALLLGFIADEPIHVVVAKDQKTEQCYVVTVYQPDPLLWTGDFKNRRSQ